MFATKCEALQWFWYSQPLFVYERARRGFSQNKKHFFGTYNLCFVCERAHTFVSLNITFSENVKYESSNP